MILTLSDLLRACAWLARREGWERSPREARLLESLTLRHEEAAALARGPEEEPAALFFALCLDLGVLGEDYLSLPIVLARNAAQAQALDLRATRFELIAQARAISAGIVSYEQTRAWFAERLAPIR